MKVFFLPELCEIARVDSSISTSTAKLKRFMKWGLVSQNAAPWQPCNGAELAVFAMIWEPLRWLYQEYP